MKRPSFQFYPGDWTSDLKLRRCSPAARGVWVDVLCAFHDSDDGYGLLRWPLKDIASTIGASMAHMLELVAKGVLRGSDTAVDEAFVYTPRTGRKDGEPITLIATQPGPLWYSKRLVKDEYVRIHRGEGTRFGDDNGGTPKPAQKAAPKPPFGDGTSSSSSSSPSGRNTEPAAQVAARPSDEPPQLSLVDRPKGPPDCPHQAVLALWAEVLPQLPQHDPAQWRGSRADHLRARWRETAAAKRWADQGQGLAYLRKLFGYVGTSPFLTGREHGHGKRPFFAELAWLVEPLNWAKTIEGKYHPMEATA